MATVRGETKKFSYLIFLLASFMMPGSSDNGFEEVKEFKKIQLY